MLEALALLTLALAQPAPAAPALRSTPALTAEPRPSVDPVAPAPPRELLTLDAALAEASAKSPELAQARARVEQVRTSVSRAWSLQLPHLSAGGSYTHYNVEATIPAGVVGPSEIVIQPRNLLAGQIELTQALVAPPAWYGIRSAKLGARAADEANENARRELLFTVAQAYYAATALKKAIAVQERQLAIGLAHEKDARIRFEAGAVPKVTLLRAEIDRARTEQDLKRSQSNFDSARVALATLLDRKDASFDVDVPPAPQLPENLDDLERTALQDRPDVRAAETTLQLAESNRQSVKARYFPVLGAFGRYTSASSGGFSGQSDLLALGLQASWNLYDGGLREADLRETGARISEAEAAKRGSENRAVAEVRRARLDRDMAVANLVKAEEELALARENQKLIEVNFRAGAATYLEVSDANTALNAAEISVIVQSLSSDLAAWRLLQTSGRFPAPAAP